MPVYNSAEYLRECIDSVLCQNYKNIELILVNDGSTDSSKKIIDNYKKNIQQ
ncbi:glycosyltransferase family 2 protein [Streptococcus sp. VTCC 12886]|uniref:glycosyltransferase family 2 protein n=1 Tax=Streptococcus sp. VTCC 12886 TaxID=3413767 RepID=UPI003D9C6C50